MVTVTVTIVQHGTVVMARHPFRHTADNKNWRCAAGKVFLQATRIYQIDGTYISLSENLYF